jgi:O-methyltransferase involved in polyketide biosynthesis
VPEDGYKVKLPICCLRKSLNFGDSYKYNMAQGEIIDRNYNTISPSAKWLILMKGYTDIPFARRTAELISFPQKFKPDFSQKDLTFWARTVHFERRYWSVDQLLVGLNIKNILELSSGYTFRGLEAIKQKGVHYIDTDLPELITAKMNFVKTLQNETANTDGLLEVLPLNALDEQQFEDTVARFSNSQLAIVNEGLLMYLNLSEKEKLCAIIHKILKERGGYWITADIYLKRRTEKLHLKFEDTLTEFFEKHQLEENKFESFEEAEAFFERMGFSIDKIATTERNKLSSFKYLLKSASLLQLFRLLKGAKTQATWRLKVSSKF